MRRTRTRRLLILLCTIVAWSSMTSASGAASPVPGGRYAGDLFGSMHCHDCVELNLANDGGELIDPSGVNDLFECEAGNFVLSSDWVGAYTRPWRNTPVRRGMFRRVDFGSFSERGQIVTGRFVTTRLLEGTIRLRGEPTCGKRRVLRFRARLVGRPDATRGRWALCDRVITNDTATGRAEVDVWERALGCTSARETARQWRWDPDCRQFGPGAMCVANGLRCEAIETGERDPGASARCRKGAGAVELVRLVACEDDDAKRRTVQAIQLDCRTALDVADRWGPSDCWLTANCLVGEWACRNQVFAGGISETYQVRCRLVQDPRRGVELVQTYA